MFNNSFLIEIFSGSLFPDFAREPAALLLFGIGLTGATSVLRRLLKRREEKLTPVAAAADAAEPKTHNRGKEDER